MAAVGRVSHFLHQPTLDRASPEAPSRHSVRALGEGVIIGLVLISSSLGTEVATVIWSCSIYSGCIPLHSPLVLDGLLGISLVPPLASVAAMAVFMVSLPGNLPPGGRSADEV